MRLALKYLGGFEVDKKGTSAKGGDLASIQYIEPGSDEERDARDALSWLLQGARLRPAEAPPESDTESQNEIAMERMILWRLACLHHPDPGSAVPGVRASTHHVTRELVIRYRPWGTTREAEMHIAAGLISRVLAGRTRQRAIGDVMNYYKASERTVERVWAEYGLAKVVELRASGTAKGKKRQLPK
jgi:hypothetical protein